MDEQQERLLLGDFIATQRRAAEMSLRQLAERAGISNPYVSQIERGLRRPSAEVLGQIATALSVSAESLYVRARATRTEHHVEHRPSAGERGHRLLQEPGDPPRPAGRPRRTGGGAALRGGRRRQRGLD